MGLNFWAFNYLDLGLVRFRIVSISNILFSRFTASAFFVSCAYNRRFKWSYLGNDLFPRAYEGWSLCVISLVLLVNNSCRFYKKKKLY